MIRQWLFLIIFSCFLLVACRSESEPLGTPTPFATPTAVIDAIPAGVQPIPLPELMADPALYQNRRIAVTGQFYRQPRLVCAGLVRTYRPPTSFVLRDGEVVLDGGGLGTGRDVVVDGLTMTINGRLLFWRGPVGCGKRAVVQNIWYIEAANVVSPRPLTNATLTPDAGVAQINGDEPTVTPTPDEFGPDLTPTPTATPDLDLPAMTPTPTATPTPTPTPDDDDEDDDETADPTATPIFDEDEILPQGEIGSGNLVGGRLEAGEVHEWRFAIRASDVLTVNAISTRGNLVLYLLDESDELLLRQDNAPPLAVESIAGFELDEPGDYRLLVEVTGAQEADYHLQFMLSDSYTLVMQGLLVDDEEEENIRLAAESDHSWHFYGEEGDTVVVLIIPLDDMDPFLRLYGPDGRILPDETGQPNNTDEFGPGEPEELIFVLPEDGLYAIQVGEYENEAGLYSIVMFFDS